MSISCVGISYRSSSFERLNSISLASFETTQFLRDLYATDGVREAYVLATCNRLEIYTLGLPSEELSAKLLKALATSRGVSFEQLKQDSFVFGEEDAIRHLFRVACGIDSLIVGEFEIMNQIRRAEELARSVGVFGPSLERFVHRALSIGRRARMETNISHGNLSIASEAVTLAEESLGGLTDKTALVIGGGELGELTAKVLANKNTATLLVGNRTKEAAVEIAERLGCIAIGFEDIISNVMDADLIVCATGAPHYILTKSMVGAAFGFRGTKRPTVLLDLSVPRNIDPELADLEGVTLLGLEDLQQEAARNRTRREGEIVRVDSIVEQEANRFQSDHRRRHSVELTSQLRRDIEDIRQRYVAQHEQRFSEENRPYLDKFTRSLVSQILHKLTVNLQQVDPSTEEGRLHLETAKVLFALEEEAKELHQAASE